MSSGRRAPGAGSSSAAPGHAGVSPSLFAAVESDRQRAVTDLRDVVLDKEPGPRPPAPSAPRRAAWALAALVLVAGAAALYWYGNRQNSSPDEPQQPARGDVQISAPPPAPLGVQTPPVDL